MWRRFLALLVALQSPLLLLTATVVLSSEAYLVIRYGGLTNDPGAVIEALNFSVQTVTTVGYGNWDNGLANDATHDGVTLKRLKLLSIPTMLVGALLFGLVVSGFTNFYAPHRPSTLPTLRTRALSSGRLVAPSFVAISVEFLVESIHVPRHGFELPRPRH